MFAADLTQMDNLEKLATSIESLDGLVNCAGIGLTLPFKFCGEDELKRVMAINFFAPVLLTQTLVKKKKINKGASIVYMASIDGTVTGHIGNSMYSATKGAIPVLSALKPWRWPLVACASTVCLLSELTRPSFRIVPTSPPSR